AFRWIDAMRIRRFETIAQGRAPALEGGHDRRARPPPKPGRYRRQSLPRMRAAQPADAPLQIPQLEVESARIDRCDRPLQTNHELPVFARSGPGGIPMVAGLAARLPRRTML